MGADGGAIGRRGVPATLEWSMDAIGPILEMIVGVALFVGIPLAILRSLDEIRERQKRIERRLDEIAALVLMEERAEL